MAKRSAKSAPPTPRPLGDCPRLAIVDPSDEAGAATARLLAPLAAASGGEVATRRELGAHAAAEGDGEILVVAYDRLDAAARAELLATFAFRKTRARLVLLSSGLSRDEYAELLGAHVLTNLVAIDDERPRTDDLLATVKKLVALQAPGPSSARREIFGLERYLPKGTPTTRATLRRASERAALFAQIEAYTQALGINKRLAALFRSAADELVTNALFNAPTDGAGNPRCATRDRALDVELEPDEVIEVHLASDRWTLGISVRDPFGSLPVARIMSTLSKCFQRDGRQVAAKPGGAGLGFYHVLDASSHFVVNIEPGVASELIALVDTSGTYKDFVAKSKSFNVFVSSGARTESNGERVPGDD